MSEHAVFDALRYRVSVDHTGTRRYFNSAGVLHRTNGPAVEYANGGKFWYQNGQLHRTDGPAVEWFNGYFEWWLNGEEVTEAQFNQAVTAL